MFFTRFIAGNIFCTILAGIILLFKKLLGTRVSLRFHYRVWMMLWISLAIVFLPVHFLNIFQPEALIPNQSLIQIFHTTDNSAGTIHNQVWTNHVSEAVTIVDHSQWMITLEVFWGIGALITLLICLRSLFQIERIRKGSVAPTDREKKLFVACQQKANVRQNIVLLQSDFVRSPLSFGLWTSYIVLPSQIIRDLTEQEIEHILLHELMHIRHRDIVTNYILCLEQVLYWCNPLIWIIFSRIKLDREAYCDWAVLNTYADPKEQLNYGYTLLRFAKQNQKQNSCMANNLCGNKIQIRYRIEKISDFSRENRKTVLRGACIILMISLLSVLQLPVLAFFANNTNIYMPDASINIDEVDYSDIFGDNNGSVVIYDQKADSYMVYHLNKAEEQIAPCSTFKIFSALNALEQGIITPEDSVLSWNGSDYEFQAWNQDHNLNSAMQNSVNWYFQYLDTTVGARELSAFYKKIGYGNACIGRDTEQYWNGSSLKISPLEQVELLQKFYNNSFDFDEANIKTVKQAMLCSENSDNKLYGKTGTGKVNEVEVIGWFIGFVETSDNTYFFAVNLQNASGTNGKEATQITYSIFHAMGIRMG